MGQTDRSDRNMVMMSSGSSQPVFKTIDSGLWHELGGSNERRYGILRIVGSSVFGSWLILDIKIRISWIHPSVFFFFKSVLHVAMSGESARRHNTWSATLVEFSCYLSKQRHILLEEGNVEEHCKVVEESELGEERRESDQSASWVKKIPCRSHWLGKTGITNHQDFGCQVVLKSRLLSVVLWREIQSITNFA